MVKFASPVMVKTSASAVTKPFSMLAKQDSLPPLPVPALQQTMEKYLSAIKPLVDEEEFEYTQDLVKDFLKPNGDGERLQNRLIQKAKTETNWVSNDLSELWNINFTYIIGSENSFCKLYRKYHTV